MKTDEDFKYKEALAAFALCKAKLERTQKALDMAKKAFEGHRRRGDLTCGKAVQLLSDIEALENGEK